MHAYEKRLFEYNEYKLDFTKIKVAKVKYHLVLKLGGNFVFSSKRWIEFGAWLLMSIIGYRIKITTIIK